MAYSDKVIDHYNEPRNVGSFDKNDDAVGTGLVGAPECGDVMKLQIKVENDQIVDANSRPSAAVLQLPVQVLLPNGSRERALMRRCRFRTQKLWKNFRCPRLKSTVRCSPKTPSRRQSAIIKVEIIRKPLKADSVSILV